MINIDESVSKGTCIDSCILCSVGEVELHLQQNRKSSVRLFLSQSWADCFIKCLNINPNWLLHINFLPLDLLGQLKNIPTWAWISVASPIHSVPKLRENNHFTFYFTDHLKEHWKPKLRVSCCNIMFNRVNLTKLNPHGT